MFDIKKQLMWSKLKVGIVITMSVAILIFAIFFAGRIESILSPKVEINAYIKDVMGLRKGSPVWISGIEIGFVKGISLHSEYGTMIVMSINENALRYIKKDSTASVQTMGLLGDKYIEISLGSAESQTISKGDTLSGTEQIDIKDIIRTGTETLIKITEFIGELDVFIKKLEKGVSLITSSKFLTDPKIYNNIEDATASLSLILKDIKESEGTLKMLINDPSLYSKMVSTVSSLEDFGKKMNEAGTLKRLAEDPSLYENLNKASSQISAIIEKIESGEGVAGSLIKDKELASELKDGITELKNLSKELSELTKDIKSNPKKYFKFSIF